MEEAPTDRVEDLSERIVDLHGHIQMIQCRLRDCIRRFDALLPRHVALQQDLDHALACMNVKQGRLDFAESFGADGVLCRNRNHSRNHSRNHDDASAEASRAGSATGSRIDERRKLKPLAVALVLAQQVSVRSRLRLK